MHQDRKSDDAHGDTKWIIGHAAHGHYSANTMKRYYNHTQEFLPDKNTPTVTNYSANAHELDPDTIIGVLEVAFNRTKAFVSESALRQTVHFFQLLERVDSDVDFVVISADSPGDVVKIVQHRMIPWDRKASARARSLKTRKESFERGGL